MNHAADSAKKALKKDGPWGDYRFHPVQHSSVLDSVHKQAVCNRENIWLTFFGEVGRGHLCHDGQFVNHFMQVSVAEIHPIQSWFSFRSSRDSST